MMRPTARSLPWLFLAAWMGSVACGGNVVVDGAPSSAGSGGSNGTGASAGTGASTGTSSETTTTSSTGTGPQAPDGGSAACQQEYINVLGELENALGCTPTANVMQCTGMDLLHDPCGCVYVANDAHPNNIIMANQEYTNCVMSGCCGQQAGVGCSPCPPPPTVGHCDSFTSQCVAGP